MKKIISILLCLALLVACAAAAAEAIDGKQELGTLKINGEFTLRATVPENYTMKIQEADENHIYAFFASEDESKPVLGLSVGLQDAWPEGSKLNNISDEDLREIEASFYDEQEDLQISYTETSHGTKLLVAKAPDASLAVIYTLYEGYEIEFTLSPAEGSALTQEQIDLCIKFLSDLDFIKPEK